MSGVLNSVYYDSESLGDKDDFLYYQVYNTQRKQILRIKQAEKLQNTEGANTTPKHYADITFTKLESFRTMDKDINKDSFSFDTHHLSTQR